MGLAMCTRCRKLSNRRSHSPRSRLAIRGKASAMGRCNGDAGPDPLRRAFKSNRAWYRSWKMSHESTVSMVTVRESGSNCR
jgi:hypothetical protein